MYRLHIENVDTKDEVIKLRDILYNSGLLTENQKNNLGFGKQDDS